MDIELLNSAIKDYDNGGLANVDFIQKAHRIYNSYATFPTSLPNAEHPYLLGIVFADFAKYYSNNINIYTSIVENALFCFAKVMKTSSSQSEKQCAAIRMLLLISDNDRVMKGIAHTFYEKRPQELYGQPLFMQQFIAQGMEPWTYETDILVNLGSHCIDESDSEEKKSLISKEDMDRFNNIVKSQKYKLEYPLVIVSAERVFDLFFDFIAEFIKTPYERRITMLTCR